MNGRQLYGLSRLYATLKMGLHKELKNFNLKQKLALNYVSKESKLTELNGEIYSNTFSPAYPSLAYDRYMKGLVKITSGVQWPVITNFAVTSRCPCNCWHCSFSDRDKKDELTLKDLRRAISHVQDLGTSVIGFTGGEPLLRTDLEDIIASVDKRSMPIFFTTGYQLTKERVRRLKSAGLKIPVISLDHYTAEYHDRGRRLKGTFDYAINAIRLFQEEGFYVAVSFVPTKGLVGNRADIFKTIEFFKGLGINDMRLTSPILSGQIADHCEEKLSHDDIKTIIDIQKKCTKTEGYPGIFAYDHFESEKYYGCGAGYNYMFIDSSGNVSPCDFTMLSFGNIKHKNISDIWDKMSSNFKIPGCDCYANVISKTASDMKPETWPLDEKLSMEILAKHRPYNRKRIPDFYKKMSTVFKSEED